MENDIEKIISNKRKYLDLKNNLELILQYLNNSIEELEIPSAKIKEFYNIDSVSIDVGKINATREELMKKKEYVKMVLVEINEKLRKLNHEINSLG